MVPRALGAPAQSASPPGRREGWSWDCDLRQCLRLVWQINDGVAGAGWDGMYMWQLLGW